MSRTGLTTRDRTRGSRGGAAPVTRLRTRRRTDPRRRRLLAAGAVLLVLAAAAWVLLASPLLAVRTVQVDGAVSLSVEEVRAAAGVSGGTPLARVDLAAAADRVARLPQVADVTVDRGWPDRVVVTLAERVPIAVVTQAGTRSLIDAEGVLFDTITADPPAGVVPLTVPSPGTDDRATRAGLAALEALPTSVRRQVTSAAASSGDDVTLVLTDGTTVLWGNAEDTERKAQVLTALIEQMAAETLEPATTIDVSAPGAVVLR